jgi:hypothetical protein
MCEKGDRVWDCARECGREPTGGEPTESCNPVGDCWEPGLVGLEGARDRPLVERLNTVGD